MVASLYVACLPGDRKRTTAQSELCKIRLDRCIAALCILFTHCCCVCKARADPVGGSGRLVKAGTRIQHERVSLRPACDTLLTGEVRTSAAMKTGIAGFSTEL